jgi:hypothetical protein
VLFQAVLKQFGGGGYGGSDTLVTDEAELRQHQKLERLYISTRAGKVIQSSYGILFSLSFSR